MGRVMSGTRVTRAMVRDAAARAFPTGGWRVQQDMVTDRWEVARWGADGHNWRVLLAGLTSREMWGALEVIAATRREDETTTDDDGR
jgi:hypothetical protein